jgi:phosphoserine phosphatase RsbU/P
MERTLLVRSIGAKRAGKGSSNSSAQKCPTCGAPLPPEFPRSRGDTRISFQSRRVLTRSSWALAPPSAAADRRGGSACFCKSGLSIRATQLSSIRRHLGESSPLPETRKPPLVPPLLTIGFLVDTLLEEYQRRLFVGLCKEAARLNVNVRCFVGGVLSHSGTLQQRNKIYAAASNAHLDGMVVAAGPLSNLLGHQALVELVAGFSPLPTCSVGIELPGVDSVAIDNAAGVREALSHLIGESGRKRIAFIRGPHGNREAEERYRVYRELLVANRLALDPDLVTTGDFEAASGSAAVTTLLDERHIGFDAIFAASDLMALGALNALLERGVAVPGRVAIAGFDDIDAARFGASPLTTVRQPLSDMGKRALESVLHQIYGTPRETHQVLPARLVKRQSTARSASGRQSNPPQLPDSVESEALTTLNTAQVRERIAAAARQMGELDGLDADWSEQLCNTLLSDAAGRRSGLVQRISFVGYVEHLLLRVADRGGDIGGFHSVISEMRTQLLPGLLKSPRQRELAENLWHEARILTSSIAERLQVQARLQSEHFRRAVREIGAELLRVTSWEQLAITMSARLPLLGIPAAALCTYRDDSSVQLRVACDGGFPLECSPDAFPQRELLPTGILGSERRRTLIIETLYVRERALGYLVLEMGPADPECYAMLRDYLTGLLRGLVAQEPNVYQ